MATRQLLLMGALAATAMPALAQTYTFSCQPETRTVGGKMELISLGDQLLGVDRRIFSFDEKASKACEVDVYRKACLATPLWTGAADATFSQISFTRERPGSASIDVLTFRLESTLFSARILSENKGEIGYSGKCTAVTNLAVELPD